jgi:hypothetical protein
MNNYQKIATICIRSTALGMFLTAFVLWGVVAVGILLSGFGVNSIAALGAEAYFIQSVFFLLLGIVLYARSKSLAKYIVEGLLDDADESTPTQ